tara:strand:+ start:1300 stop:2082 length:783 start_codon:yes stop_codon:yes gene_type:complete
MSIYHKEKAKYLVECLDSIAAQTLQPTEVIIVHDGYIPIVLKNVIKKYRKYLNIKTPMLPLSKGLGNALNEGLKSCKYEFIVRVDADDINLPTRFEENIKSLNNGYDLIGSYIQEFDENKKGKIRKAPLTNKKIRSYCKYRSPFNHMAVAYKKKIVLKAGGYSNNFIFKEDYYLWVKIINLSSKVCNLPKVLVLARFNENSIARRGGRAYILSEFNFQKFLWDNNINNIIESFCIGSIRILLFMLPKKIKIIFYKLFLRS